MTTTLRAHIIAQARQWLGTPFHHQARVKGVGADCAGLVIGVARALEIVGADFDVAAYPRTPDGTTLIRLLDQHMTRIELAAMQGGDVVAVAFGKDPQHVGIVADYRHGGHSIIHAHSITGSVIETRLLFGPSMRFVAAYQMPGVA